MALFTMQRFGGEDDISKVSKCDQAARILEELNRSATVRLKNGGIKSSATGRLKNKAAKPKGVEKALPAVPVDGKTKKCKKKNEKKRKSSESDESIVEKETTKKKKVGAKRRKLSKQADEEDADSGLEEEATLPVEADRAVAGEGGSDKDVSADDGDVSADDEDVIAGDMESAEAENENDDARFPVLGGSEHHVPAPRVGYQLPAWLARPRAVVGQIRQGGLDIDQAPFLNSTMLDTLREDGILRLFPVQEVLIPAVLASCRPSLTSGLYGFRPPDICCSSPTGSGKTLAFALPIVQALSSRLVPRVRALILLPVRDLAKQVHRVFVKLCRHTSLKVGLVVGQKSLAQEQSTLVVNDERGESRSLVDILVCTPGRLVDHIQHTEGLDLTSLRFVVIDEADRVLDDIKQDWLHHLDAAVCRGRGLEILSIPLTAANIGQQKSFPPQKLLFSATLTQNPEKLKYLNLFQPQLYTSVVRGGTKHEDKESAESRTEGAFLGKYTTPVGLTEYFTECTPQQRPLLVLHYLHNLKFRHVLCFTNFNEATHRLTTLVRLFGGIEVREFSSKMDNAKRMKVIRDFETGKVDMIVCSDAMARGMDIENVKYVISYEPPPRVKTYIHRVGRAARAGRTGTAVSLLERSQVHAFKQMVATSGKQDVSEQKVRASMFSNLVERYQQALSELPVLLRGEKLKKSAQKR